MRTIPNTPLVLILSLAVLALVGCEGSSSPAPAQPSVTPSVAIVQPSASATRAAPEATAPSPLPTATSEPAPQDSALPLSDSPLPQPTPEPSTELTAPPLPSAEAAAPAEPDIISFTVVPTRARNLGDTLHLTWEASGERAEVCPTNCFGPTVCQDVSLSGEMEYVADENSLGYNGFALRVSAGGVEAVESVTVQFLCEDLRQWFFAPPPPYCPVSEPAVSYAAGQYFERGFMVWVRETDQFYIFLNEPDATGTKYFYSTTGLELKPDASEDNRIGEDPPPGLVEPMSGFGLIWRGEVEWPEAADARERLGWAMEPEFGFETTVQYAIPSCPRIWIAYLRGPRDEILRLAPASTIGWPLVWDQVGP